MLDCIYNIETDTYSKYIKGSQQIQIFGTGWGYVALSIRFSKVFPKKL